MMTTLTLTPKQTEVLTGLLRDTCNNTEDSDLRVYEAILEKLDKIERRREQTAREFRIGQDGSRQWIGFQGNTRVKWFYDDQSIGGKSGKQQAEEWLAEKQGKEPNK